MPNTADDKDREIITDTHQATTGLGIATSDRGDGLHAAQTTGGGASGEGSRLDAHIAEARDAAGRLARQVEAGLLPSEATKVLQDVQLLLGRLTAGEEEPAADQDAERTLFFDVSDLLGYFPYNRLPTGIQRVQISTILHLMQTTEGWKITPCRFVERINAWRVVPSGLFTSLCRMSLEEGDAEAPDWRAAFARLDSATLGGTNLVFPKRACLVNLGTSWWLPDYFSAIRQAKMASGIRYVPLIHDMIPAIMPEYCNHELVHEFVDWVVGVLQHADFFLAVSNATKRDLIALAGKLGVTVPEDHVVVVPLASELTNSTPSDAWTRVSLAQWNLRPGSYVLFVSTIEARKNQLGAFDAWQALINTHGTERVPTLVCVGKRGFGSDRALARLEASPNLLDRVLLLANVDDAALEALYRQCLFTIYPSLYEGWGLPVSESLAYGKVPVTSDNSSLPEAGGGFSVLFETGSQAAFVAALEQMCFSEGFRREKEVRVAAGFKARTWGQVAHDLTLAVARFHDDAADIPQPWSIPEAPYGYYPLVRNREMRLRRGIGSAEIYRKGGSGWWRLEDFGAWTRAGGGELAMRLDPAVRHLAIELHGLPDLRARYTISTGEGAVLARGEIPAKAIRWLVLDLPEMRPEKPFVLHVGSLESATVIDPITKKKREIGVGVGAFFVFDARKPRGRTDFVEAVALGSLDDSRVDVLAL